MLLILFNKSVFSFFLVQYFKWIVIGDFVSVVGDIQCWEDDKSTLFCKIEHCTVFAAVLQFLFFFFSIISCRYLQPLPLYSTANTTQEQHQDQSASAIRIRDNQRRSRARRKEYVENLERKVQEYERRGVEATLEMQHAARTVALENSRLKMMLERMGAGESDVDAFLAACQDREAAEALSSVSMRPVHHDKKDGEEKSEKREDGMSFQDMSAEAYLRGFETKSYMGNYQNGSFSGTVPSSSHGSTASTLDTPLDVLASATLQHGTCCDGKTHCTTSTSEAPSPSTVEPSTGAVTPTSAYAPTLSPGATTVVQEFSSPMEMSCNAAAAIIAEMQGHGDANAAKSRLGCRGQHECVVKNTVLFQILEGEGNGNFS